MKTEEEYIEEYITRSYEVITMATSFGISDKVGKKTFTLDSFKKEIEQILMSASFPVIDIWYERESKELVTDLDIYFKTIDFSSDNSLVILNNLIRHFDLSEKTKGKYNTGFIKSYFYEYHKIKNINPRLNDYVKNINNSNEIVNIIADDLEYEPSFIRDYVLTYLNDWYCQSILGEKIQDLFRQFVVTLGKQNWKVTWVGHGEVTREKIKQHFPDESEPILKIIFEKYSNWYQEEITDSCERMLKIS